MIRFLILAGYFELMMSLQISGRIDQYINTHYRYLVILSMVLALALALIQLYLWTRQGETNSHEHTCCDNHCEHHHGMEKKSQKILVYCLLTLPIIVGLLFPTVSLDATIVSAKGFHFPISKESVGDPEVNTQYLKPNTSIYFNQSDYNKRMDKELKHYKDASTIHITDTNYLNVMELIYNYPSEFQGKHIDYTGFVYNDPVEKANKIFVFRFGVIHCVADSGVFGLLNYTDSTSSTTTFKNNEWVKVSGVISTDYYAPFKASIPTLKVDAIKKVSAPKNQYVYYNFDA